MCCETGFPRILESPWFFFLLNSRPRKSLKKGRSLKVLDFIQTQLAWTRMFRIKDSYWKLWKKNRIGIQFPLHLSITFTYLTSWDKASVDINCKVQCSAKISQRKGDWVESSWRTATWQAAIAQQLSVRGAIKKFGNSVWCTNGTDKIITLFFNVISLYTQRIRSRSVE